MSTPSPAKPEAAAPGGPVAPNAAAAPANPMAVAGAANTAANVAANAVADAGGGGAGAAPTAGTAAAATNTTAAAAGTGGAVKADAKPTIAKAKLPASPLGQMSEADRRATAQAQGGDIEAGSDVMTKILKVVEPYVQHLNTDEPFDLKAFNAETMTLYHAVFVACTTGQQEVNPATLYNGYLESVQGFVASVSEPKLAAGEKKAATDNEAMSESMISAFCTAWTKHLALIKHLNKIFLYLDRCQQLLDQPILRIKPAGMHVFRSLVLDPYSIKIRDALLKGLEIEADKRSDTQKEVLAAAVTTFAEMGKEFNDIYLTNVTAHKADDKALKAHFKDMFTDTHKAVLAPEPVAPPPQQPPPQHYYDEPMNRGSAGAGVKDYKRGGGGGGGGPYAGDMYGMPPRGGGRRDPRDRDMYGDMYGGGGGDPYGYGYDDPHYGGGGGPYGGPPDPYGYEDPRHGGGGGGRPGRRGHGGGGGRGHGGHHGGGGGGGGGGSGSNAWRQPGGPPISCPTCTLENASQNYKCEACGTKLPPAGAGGGGGGGGKSNAKEPERDSSKTHMKVAEPDGGGGKAADPKPAAAPTADADTWICRACTFSNPNAFPRCNMCDSAR